VFHIAIRAFGMRLSAAYAVPGWRTLLPVAFRLASPHECRKFVENASGGSSVLERPANMQVEAWTGRLGNPTSKWQATIGNRPILESS
jgi:hypothetical protein